MSKDAIMNVPDGYMVRLFGSVQAGDLVWYPDVGVWLPARSLHMCQRIDSLPTPMVARKRQEHD